MKFESDAWSYYLEIPNEIGHPFIVGNDRRIKCTIGDEPPIPGALMPKGEIYTIYIKKDFMRRNGLEEGDKVQILIEKESSKYGIPIPESFEVLLDQDVEGSRKFHKLTPGKQRSLIHIVSKVKNVDSQLPKGLAIMHHLKEADGTLDFKRLNQLIKEYNNRK